MDKRIIFLLLTVTVWIIIFLTKYILISDTLYYNTLIEQFSYEQISFLLEQSKKWEWISYVIVPIILFIKICFVSICLSIGIYFIDNKFNFEKVFEVVLQSEFIFLIPSFLELLWFSFIEHNYSINDLQYFYPLSALNMFDKNTIETWLIYPLQTLNIFEFIYWVLLARGITNIINRDLTKSFEIVIAGYGTGLLLWIVIIMFITVTNG